jgi:hypothetical protein
VSGNDYFSVKRKQQQFDLFLNAIDEQLKTRFYSDVSVQKQINLIKNKGSIQPFSLAKQLLNQFFK